MHTKGSSIGVWLIGAKGGVATTTIVGLAALEQGLVEQLGLVSQLPQFRRLPMPDFSQLVVGGHEIRRSPLCDEAYRLVRESRTVSPEVFAACEPHLQQIDARIRPGTVIGVGPAICGLADWELPEKETPRQAIARLSADIKQFAAEEQLEHVVVVNLASTEPLCDPAALPGSWAELERHLDDVACPIPASTIYAIAAFQAGCSYINFTPSLGSAPTAVDELCRLRGLRHFGCDGKTGETLLKSVLAPMFARRNLRVLSWVGHNIFGNMDGQVLSQPANKQAKIASKDRLLGEILGYRPQTHVSIEYIESLGDWKTAWDHVHFAGFLGTRMTLQLTWQGCDSALAAPLVIDLVRLTEAARRRGHIGPMPFLASFFKSPYGVSEHRFEQQFQMLERWAESASEG